MIKNILPKPGCLNYHEKTLLPLIWKLQLFVWYLLYSKSFSIFLTKHRLKQQQNAILGHYLRKTIGSPQCHVWFSHIMYFVFKCRLVENSHDVLVEYSCFLMVLKLLKMDIEDVMWDHFNGKKLRRTFCRDMQPPHFAMNNIGSPSHWYDIF